MAASYNESSAPKTSPKQNRIVIVGCSGMVGEEVVKAIKATTKPSYPKIVICSRDTESSCAKKFCDEEGCEVVHGDLNEVDSLKDPFKGASALLLITPNAQNRAELIQNGLNAAKAASVPFVIVLSFILADLPSTVFGAQFNQIEMATKRSGLTYCIVRVPLYTDNLTEHFDCIRDDGKICGAMSGTASYTTINVSDVAAAIGSILDNGGKHHNVTHVITGPTWCKDEAATEFSNALGQRVVYEQKPLEEIRKTWSDKGMQEWQLQGMTEIWRMIDEGRFVFPDSEFKKVVGRNPKGLHDWVEKHKECLEKGEKKHSTICKSCDTAYASGTAASSSRDAAAAKSRTLATGGLAEDWTATSGSPGIAAGRQ